jgi:hypothetical protein
MHKCKDPLRNSLMLCSQNCKNNYKLHHYICPSINMNQPSCYWAYFCEIFCWVLYKKYVMCYFTPGPVNWSLLYLVQIFMSQKLAKLGIVNFTNLDQITSELKWYIVTYLQWVHRNCIQPSWWYGQTETVWCMFIYHINRSMIDLPWLSVFESWRLILGALKFCHVLWKP